MPIDTIAYDRNMVNLVFELKRTLPLQEQADFRISSPDLLKRVKDIYNATSKPETKDLAKRLLQSVSLSSQTARSGHQYRGATTVSEVAKASPKPQAKRMYRGLPID